MVRAELNKRQMVAKHLRDRIKAGEWELGDPLPALEELAEFYKVSFGTVLAARDLLADEGLVRSKPRVATFVIHIPEARHDLALEALRSARATIDQAITVLEREGEGP